MEEKNFKKIEDYQEKTAEAPKENKAEGKKEDKKIIKKETAFINGKDLPISTKHSIFICEYIRGKSIEQSIQFLELVLKKKTFLPMRGEIPHRKSGVGRYPEKAIKVFIKLLKSLNANAQVNGLENPVISKSIANLASRPHKRGGSERFKRSHVYIEVKEKK